MRPKAFTLLELLVVVTIIVVLLALLVPGLDKAMSAAELAKCTANLSGIGKAMVMYHQDSQDTYPLVANGNDWGGLLGGPGNLGYGGNNFDVDKRPLNKYLGFSGTKGEVKIAKCPADKGESEVASPNGAYDAWGTSYIAYIADYSGIQHVYGYPGLAPMKSAQIRRRDNKVILPEWPTLDNRPYSKAPNRWHRDEPDAVTRYHNTLFADSHVELFGYDIALMTLNSGTPNPNFEWW